MMTDDAFESAFREWPEYMAESWPDWVAEFHPDYMAEYLKRQEEEENGQNDTV